MFMNGTHYKPSALSVSTAQREFDDWSRLLNCLSVCLQLDFAESRANFHSQSVSNFELPSLTPLKQPADKLPEPRELVKSPVIREFLMKNWSKKRNETNAVSEIKS